MYVCRMMQVGQKGTERLEGGPKKWPEETGSTVLVEEPHTSYSI
jgi:hypothetical protein